MLRQRRAPMRIFRGVCKGRRAVGGWIYSHFLFSILAVYIYRLGTHEMRTWFSRSESTCASSDGGPGLNLGEHIAGRSRLGTGGFRMSTFHLTFPLGHCKGKYAPKKPSFSLSSSGSAISAFTPHTTVVAPMRTSAEPSAVEMEPTLSHTFQIDQLCVFFFSRRKSNTPTFTDTSLKV